MFGTEHIIANVVALVTEDVTFHIPEIEGPMVKNCWR